MTLIEYLQTEATKLRDCNCRDETVMFGNCLRHALTPEDADALIAHINRMLELHGQGHRCWEIDGRPPHREFGRLYLGDCPSLQSVARLVSVVSGTPIPEGAQ